MKSLMELYLNKDTLLCMSLSGRPSNFGTRLHNFLYRELGLNFVYKAFTTAHIREAIGGIRALGIRGSAISMPFKEACIEHLDALDSSAERIMSVNTIVNDEGHLTGFNTDYIAVFELLKSHGVSPDMHFSVLGSGGMAKAVVCALRDLNFHEGLIVSRNEKTGSTLAKQYGYVWQSELGSKTPELIINATPIGMAQGQEAEDLAYPKHVIETSKIVFDVVALPTQTPLLKYAGSLHKPVISGADVIVLQAIEQFVLYTGIRPDKELINRAAHFART